MAKLSFSIALNLLTQGVKKGANEVEAIFKRMGSTITATLGSLGMGFGAFSFGRQMIQAGKEFESGMARVRAVSNATAADFKMMEDEAKRLGATTKYTAGEAAGALENLVRNGLTPKQATAALSKTLELAQANSIGLAEAADICTNAMNGFGLKTEDLGRVNDVLSSTAAHSATNVLDLAEAMKIAAPVATTAGVSIEETNAALGVLANVGMRGTDAGTGVKQMLIALSAQTPKAKKALAEFGVTVDENRLKTEGLASILSELKEKGVGNSVAAMADIFGKLAAPKAAALINNAEALQQLTDTLNNADGENARMFEQSLGKMENALASLASAWEGLQIRIFQGGEGMFVAPLNALTAFVRYATENFGTLAVKFAAIFVGTKLIGYFRTMMIESRTAFTSMASQAAAAHSKVNMLQRNSALLRKQITALEAQLAKASADQRLAIEIQLQAKTKALAANRLATFKAINTAQAADAAAAAVKSGSAWQIALLKIKTVGLTVARSLKAVWSTVAPLLFMTVITELIAKIYELATASKDAASAEKRIADIEAEAAVKAAENGAKVKALVAVIHDETAAQKDREAAIRSLQKIIPDYTAKLSNEGKVYGENTKALKKYNQQLKEKAILEGAQNALTELGKQSAENLIAQEQKRAGIAELRRQQAAQAANGQPRTSSGANMPHQVMAQAGGSMQILAAEAELRALERQGAAITSQINLITDKFGKRIAASLAAVADAEEETNTTLSNYTSADDGGSDHKTELQRIQESYASSLERLGLELENGVISQRDYERELNDLKLNTYLQAASGKEAATRTAEFTKELEKEIKARKSKGYYDLIDVEENYKKELETLNRKYERGALTNDEYSKAMLSLINSAVDAASAIDYSGSELVGILKTLKDKANKITVGKESDYQRDKTFDYKLDKNKQSTILTDELELAKKRLEDLKSGALKLTGDLAEQINAQMAQVKGLDEALKLAKVKEDVKDLQKALRETKWNGAKDIVSNSDQIVSAWSRLGDTLNNADANGWEKIMAIWNTLTSTVDGIVGIVETINKWTEASEKLKLAKQAEAMVDTQTTQTKIANNAAGMASDAQATAATVTNATTNVAANTSEAASSAGKSAAKMPFPYNLIAIAGAVMTVLGIMATLPKFAGGGIIHGVSGVVPAGYPSDSALVRLQSGEMVLNGSQQRHLFDALDGGQIGKGGHIRVSHKIKGTDLYLLIETVKDKFKLQ